MQSMSAAPWSSITINVLSLQHRHCDHMLHHLVIPFRFDILIERTYRIQVYRPGLVKSWDLATGSLGLGGGVSLFFDLT